MCPCGSQFHRDDCCGPLIEAKMSAATPVALMRSRYTAYVEGNSRYLLDTWLSQTRPTKFTLQQLQWVGLRVIRDDCDLVSGTVEFVERYKENGRATRLHEISRFVKLNGRWYYADGQRGSTDSSVRAD